MSHWLVVDDSSSDFLYAAGWFTSSGSSKLPSPFRSTYHSTNTSTTFSFSFEGTSFAVYGAGHITGATNWPKASQLECSVDRASVSVDSIITAPGFSGAGQWCGQDNLSNGRHSVNVVAKPIAGDSQTLYFDYVAILPPSGLSLSNQSVVFDGKDSTIQYGDGWSSTSTNQTGASLLFNFVGVGVSLYGSTSSTPNNNIYRLSSGSYSLDGAQPQAFTWTTSTTVSQKLFQTSRITPGNHTIEVAYLPKTNPPPTLMVQYFVVDTEAIASHKTSSVALPLIITFSILGGFIVIVGAWFLRRQHRKRRLQSTSSYSLDSNNEQLRVEPLMTLPTNVPSDRKSRLDVDSAQGVEGIGLETGNPRPIAISADQRGGSEGRIESPPEYSARI